MMASIIYFELTITHMKTIKKSVVYIGRGGGGADEGTGKSTI